MRTLRATAATLMLIVTACGTAPGTAGPTSAPTARSSTPIASAVPTSPNPSQAAPHESAGSTVDDCDTRQIAATDAQNTMVLLWETIDYQVQSDEDWQAEVDGEHLDVPRYRAAVELVVDLPDVAHASFPDYLWSMYSGTALELATLLEQAEASGTPFADGIGAGIRDLAIELRREGMWGIYGAVDAMCFDPADEIAATGIDELVALMVPPNSTETDRLTSPTFSTFTYESADSMDALTVHYESAIPAAGWDILWTDTTGDGGTYWDMGGGGLQWTVIIRPTMALGRTEVDLSFYGQP